MRGLINRVIIVLVALFMIFPKVFAVEEVEAESINHKVKEYTVSRDIKLNGINGRGTYSFFVPKYMDIKGDGTLNLKISKSDISKYNYEALEVFLNNKPVTTVELKDESGSKYETKISIPNTEFKEGYNILEFRGIYNVEKEEDSNKENQSLWIYINENTMLEVPYEEKEDPVSLKEYPYPYINFTKNDNVGDSIIVLNDEFTEKEVSAALNIIQGLTKEAQYLKFNIPIKKFSDLSKDDKEKNLIYIGNIDKTPKEFKDLLKEDEINNLESKSYIKEYKSPFKEDNKLLFIGSKNEDKLLLASQFLSSNIYLSRVEENGQYIEELEKLDLNDEGNKVYFKDFNYEDIEINSKYNTSYTYTLDLKGNERILNEAYLELNFGYSDLIDFDKSFVKVYINDIPVGDKKLEKLPTDTLRIKIPSDMKNLDELNIKVEFHLEPIEEFKEQKEKLWAVIYGNSFVDLGVDVERIRNLSDYYSFFKSKNTLSDVELVLPDEISSNYLTLASNLVSEMSKGIKQVSNINVIRGKDFAEGSKNYIVLGTPSENSAFSVLNSYLPVNYVKNLKEFKSSGSLPILKDKRKDSGVAEIFKSPWYGENSILAITSPEESQVSKLVNLLCNKEVCEKINGDILVLDSNGKYTFNFFNEPKKEEAPKENNTIADPSKVETTTNKEKDKNNDNVIVIATFFLILTSITCIIIMLKKRKSKKSK